jgi:hypothetical protein
MIARRSHHTWLAIGALAALPAVAPAQGFARAGAHVLFGDYRETAASLHYQGAGVGFSAGFTKGKFSADGAFATLSYKPVDENAGLEDFKTVQIDGWLRYYVANGISLEAGFTRRTTDPEFAAQSASAGRFGLRGSYLLGPGADLAVRGNYLFGGKFSGGGKAAFGIEVGLGLSVGASNGRWRLTADYAFQRFNRTTTTNDVEAKVPLQQALARVGAALGF